MQNFELVSLYIYTKKNRNGEEIITMCPVIQLAHGGENPLQVASQGARVCTIRNTK